MVYMMNIHPKDELNRVIVAVLFVLCAKTFAQFC